MNLLPLPSPDELAAAFDAEHRLLSMHNTATQRTLCRKYSAMLHGETPQYVLDFARQLLFSYAHRWQAYELIAMHRAAFRSLHEVELEEFGQGINSWWSVDSFARTLSGPAWKEGLVTDELFAMWAESPDMWWRRAALVSTVAFNVRSHGGKGDTQRTLAICEMLVADHEDMVVKALSWALRELVYFDRKAVDEFMQAHEDVLARRVKREVGNKLSTGLKFVRKKST